MAAPSLFLSTLLTAFLWATVESTPPFQLPDYDGIVESEEADSGLAAYNPSADPDPAYRLPLSVVPINYDLTLVPMLKGNPFPQYAIPGFVSINIECRNATRLISMHAKNMDILRVTVSQGSRRLAVDYSPIDVVTDIFNINLKEEDLVPGNRYKIELDFISQISTSPSVLSGMYLSYYVDPSTGERRELATTQLQATHARAVFPCFDEPKFKARFQVTIGVQITDDCIDCQRSFFNMDLIDSLIGPDRVFRYDRFQVTPPMSTYLLAFIVSDFIEESADEASYRVPIKVWGPPHYMTAGGGVYAAGAVSKLMNYYENLTDFPYDLPKLDSVAIPQFAAGAMENWGLNTYRIEYLLHIPGENTEADRKKITQVLAHEVSHQWYGNVITCDWWAETWMNEGFARFLQYRGMQYVAPELKNDIAIISDAVHLAMIFDQGPNSHPVIKEVVTQADASTIFNRISYEKAASLLRTLESVLTREVFDDGIRTHLQSKAYNTVVPEDLWNVFQIVGASKLPQGMTVHEMMRPWMMLSGYPLVRVSVGGPDKIFVSQEKYLLNSGSASSADSRELSSWNIPVSVNTPSDPSVTRVPAFWIPETTTLTTYTVDTSNWIILNAEVAGYYRVMYDNALFNLIKQQLDRDHKVFTPGTRSQLLEDYFQFSEARYVPIETALDLTSYLGSETELVVWTSLIPHIKKFVRRLSWDPPALQSLKDYILPRTSQVLSTIGWDNQTQDDKGAHVILRAQLFDISLALDDTPRTDYAQSLFNQWIQTPQNRSIIPVDLRPMVFCAGVQTAELTTWNRIGVLYVNEPYFWTKSQLLRSLSCSSNSTILEYYLNLAQNPNNPFGFTLQETLQSIAENSQGRPLVCEFIQKLVTETPTEANGRIFSNVLSTFSTYWHQQSDLDYVTRFIEAHPTAFPSSLSSIDASISRIKDNIHWWSVAGSQMVNWLAARI